MDPRNPRIVKLRTTMRKVPTFESSTVLVPTVCYDAELECFFVDGRIDTLRHELRQLPANFITHEFLDVDASSLESLLSFQQDWGILTNPLRYPLRTAEIGYNRSIEANPAEGEQAPRHAKELAEKLSERHSGFSSLRMRYIDEPRFYPFAHRDEVQAAVHLLRDTVTELIEAKAIGYNTLIQCKIEDQVSFIDRAVSPYFPLVDTVPPDASVDSFGMSNEAETPPVLPLSVAVLAQLIGYLNAESGFCTCENCGKYFLFKRHREGTYIERVRPSKYCSDICQEQAKNKRLTARRKAERQKERESRERG